MAGVRKREEHTHPGRSSSNQATTIAMAPRRSFSQCVCVMTMLALAAVVVLIAGAPVGVITGIDDTSEEFFASLKERFRQASHGLDSCPVCVVW